MANERQAIVTRINRLVVRLCTELIFSIALPHSEQVRRLLLALPASTCWFVADHSPASSSSSSTRLASFRYIEHNHASSHRRVVSQDTARARTLATPGGIRIAMGRRMVMLYVA